MLVLVVAVGSILGRVFLQWILRFGFSDRGITRRSRFLISTDLPRVTLTPRSLQFFLRLRGGVSWRLRAIRNRSLVMRRTCLFFCFVCMLSSAVLSAKRTFLF